MVWQGEAKADGRLTSSERRVSEETAGSRPPVSARGRQQRAEEPALEAERTVKEAGGGQGPQCRDANVPGRGKLEEWVGSNADRVTEEGTPRMSPLLSGLVSRW